MELMQSIGTGFIVLLVLDFKGDFVDVAQRLGRDIWDHYTAPDGFRIGCGPPSLCINNINWINEFTRLISAQCGLKFSEAVLASVMRIAVSLLNTPPSDHLQWPSLLLIEQLLHVLPKKLIATKDQYIATLQHQLDYLQRHSGNLLACETGFDLSSHLYSSLIMSSSVTKWIRLM